MANMSDSRVPRVLAHAEACREAYARGDRRPRLRYNLQHLDGIDLSDADLTRANLHDAKLGGADLKGANLNGADLYGALLNRAKLIDANLTNADLKRANLRGADLSGAKLEGADLAGADLERANVILLTSPSGHKQRPHILLQPEEDGKLRIKVIPLRY